MSVLSTLACHSYHSRVCWDEREPDLRQRVHCCHFDAGLPVCGERRLVIVSLEPHSSLFPVEFDSIEIFNVELYRTTILNLRFHWCFSSAAGRVSFAYPGMHSEHEEKYLQGNVSIISMMLFGILGRG